MIVIRFGVHYSMQDIDDPKIKLGRTLENLRRFFYGYSFYYIIVNYSYNNDLAIGIKKTDLYKFVIAKEAIWSLMTIIFHLIYIKRNKSTKSF